MTTDPDRNNALYDEAAAGFDAWDKVLFGANVRRRLLAMVDPATLEQLLIAAAADTNRSAR